MFVLSKLISLHRILAKVGDKELTLITRVAPLFPACAAAVAEAINFGMIKLVNKKCPIWLVAKCISIPSSDSVREGTFITPALLMRMSILGMSDQERTEAAAARTEVWDERSRFRGR